MIEKSRKDSLSGPTARPYQEQAPVAPRATGNEPTGDSEAIKRYRYFFQTHNFSGLPHRDDRATHERQFAWFDGLEGTFRHFGDWPQQTGDDRRLGGQFRIAFTMR